MMRSSSVVLLVAVTFLGCKGRESPPTSPETPALSTTTDSAAPLEAWVQTAAPPPATAPPPVITSAPEATGGGPEAPIPTTESAVAPEVNPPGDIPDSQVFIHYRSDTGGYDLEVPEGWARTVDGTDVNFVDKLDGVKVTVRPGTAAPTAASARESEARQLEQAGRAVQIVDVRDVTLPSGPAVVIKFASNSEPNPVTNKQVRLENEMYLYFSNGRLASLTLWAPQGADNVDQWTRMSRSFRWM